LFSKKSVSTHYRYLVFLIVIIVGVTYIDENVGPESSAFYLGIFYTMGIVGPALGYSIGGQFLNIHTDFLRLVVGYY
jgi:hypothetical protein